MNILSIIGIILAIFGPLSFMAMLNYSCKKSMRKNKEREPNKRKFK